MLHTELKASVDGYTYSLQTSGHSSSPYATLNPSTLSTIATFSHNTSTTHTAGPLTTTSASSPPATNNNTPEATHTIYAQRYAKYLAGTHQRIYRSTNAEVKDKEEEVTVVVELIFTEAEGYFTSFIDSFRIKTVYVERSSVNFIHRFRKYLSYHP